MTRRAVLSDAIDKCIRELYSLAQPSVDYDNFIEENKVYLKKEKEYYSLPENDRPTYREYMGPKPYEFYYLPREVFKEIADSYVYAYRLDEKQEFLTTINLLKEYCKSPIVDKWIEGSFYKDGTQAPGHRGYEHPDNLEKELYQILKEYFNDSETDPNAVAKEVQNKFFEFLDMAGNFYDFNRYLNGFNMNVYLGGTPNSNKEAVIENWKKYRNKDIKIDDSKYINDEE